MDHDFAGPELRPDDESQDEVLGYTDPARRARVGAAFRKFQETGSPRALSRVFDFVAPELLLLAGQLLGDPAIAEDVVQDTFLTAIERVQTWPPEKDVEAWLVGILHRRVRAERRRGRRVLDKRRVPKERLADPAQDIAVHEVQRELQSALRRVHETNRDVVRLVLLHGMTMTEVAKALGRKREAVKTQYRRGMEQLRRVIPAGLSTATLLLVANLTAGQGLAQMRRVVLASAKSAAVVTGLGANAGGWIAACAAIFVVTAVGLAASLFWRHDRGATPSVGDVVEAAQRNDEPRTRQDVSGRVRRTQAMPAKPTPVTEASGRFGQLEIELIAVSDAVKTAGVPVHIFAMNLRDVVVSREAVTDRHGRCAFDEVPPGDYLAVTARGRWTVVPVRPGRSIAAQIESKPGLRFQGVAVDEHDRPVADAKVFVGPTHYNLELHVEACRTDARGRFELADLGPMTFVGVKAPGLGSSRIVWSAGAGNRVSTFRMKPALEIVGQVVLPDGTAATGARLMLGKALTAPFADVRLPRVTTTDELGMFRLEASAAPAKQKLWVRAPGHAPRVLSVDVAAHEFRPLRLSLLPACRVSGVVYDSRGKPVERAAVYVTPREFTKSARGQDEIPLWMRVFAQTNAQGRYVIPYACPGDVRLSVTHRSLGSATDFERIEGPEFEWSPRLKAAGAILGRVVDAQGRALSGWRVHVRAAGRPDASIVTDAKGCFRFDDRLDEPHELKIRPQSKHLRIYPSAEFRATIGPLQRVYRVASTPTASVTAIVPGSLLTNGRNVDVEFVDLATGRGTVFGDVPAGARLELDVCPGLYELRVFHDRELCARLDRVIARDGEQTDLGLLPVLQQGRVEGIVRILGSPVMPSGSIAMTDTEKRTHHVPVRLGRIPSAKLPAGHYSAAFVMPGGRSAFAELRVEPDRITTLDLVVRRGLPVRFAGSEAVSRPGRFYYSIVNARGDAVLAGTATSTFDRDATFTLRLPPGRYRLTMRDLRREQEATRRFALRKGGVVPVVRIPQLPSR